MINRRMMDAPSQTSIPTSPTAKEYPKTEYAKDNPMSSKKEAMSTKKDIFMATLDRLTMGTSFHCQMADMNDFLGLRGYKRLHEYQYFMDSAEIRAIKRYFINHHNKILLASENLAMPDIIPDDWLVHTRFEVSPDARKEAIKKNWELYHEWEKETKECYEEYYCMLMELGAVYDGKVMGELVKDSEKELKHLERDMLTLSAMDYDIVYVESVQYDIHEHYRKLEEKIGIFIK